MKSLSRTCDSGWDRYDGRNCVTDAITVPLSHGNAKDKGFDEISTAGRVVQQPASSPLDRRIHDGFLTSSGQNSPDTIPWRTQNFKKHEKKWLQTAMASEDAKLCMLVDKAHTPWNTHDRHFVQKCDARAI